jgi:hypothetical protein
MDGWIPESQKAAAYARTLPWRKVVDPRPVTEYCEGRRVADHHDMLECGHVVTHSMCERKPATKRRCYVCGREARS